MNAPPLSAALAAAARAIAAVLKGQTPEAELARLSAELRPAAIDLAFTALRDGGRGDFLLGRLLQHPLQDKAAHALLLVALARLERRPGEAHTLVDQSVTAAAKPFKGLVNALLRTFQRRRDELLAAADGDDVARWRHPAWWLDLLRTAHPDRWQDIVATGNSHPPLCLRINRRRTASADFAHELEQAGIAARARGDSAFLLDKPLPVERIPGFREGHVSVQDWGAQQAAPLLDAQDGMRVLDACAAPGGKAAHLLERADLALTALEVDAQRARRIAENLQRLGLAATVKVADARDRAAWWDGRPFERILVDAPCSASGVARRHPDIKRLRRAGDVAGFARAQAEILDALWLALAPGGKMLYCTCSVFPEENVGQISAFLQRHADARLLPTGDMMADWQLLPSTENDGFYYALLCREN